jgi:hypothetical protein
MNFIRPLILLIALIFTSGPFQVPAQQSGDGDRAVNLFIREQAKKLRGSEYLEARKIVRGDLDGNGSQDLAVQYTIEGMKGSNNYTFFLAVFLNQNGRYTYQTHREIGGKNNRDVTLKSIENGKILLDTMEYLPSDPSCCPSKKATAQFVLADGKLKEITEK